MDPEVIEILKFVAGILPWVDGHRRRRRRRIVP